MIAFLNRRPFTSAIVMIVIVVLIFWFISRLIAWGGCNWYGYQTGRDVRYVAFIGCMVKFDGKWYPRNELRVIQ